MPANYRTRAKTRKPPTASEIAAALAFYAGARPPPDPEKTKAAGRAPEAALKDSNEHPQNSTTRNQYQAVSHTMLLARLMPKTYAALLANGAIISGLGQALPAAAVAIVSMIEGAR